MDVYFKQFFLAFIILFFSAQSTAKPIQVSISGGINALKLKNEPLVAMTPIVSNTYQSKNHWQWKGFWGLSLGSSLDLEQRPYQLGLALAGYFFDLDKVKGVEFPFSNDGSYDSLNYQFLSKSRSLMLELKGTYTACNWQPSLLLGLGESTNRLYHYQEVPSNPLLTAAAVSPAFSDQHHNSFAYELGASLAHALFEDPRHKINYKGALSYRYFNLGKAQLGSFPAQTSAQGLEISPLYTQGLLFSLEASFY